MEFSEILTQQLVSLIGAILLILIGFILARFIKKIVYKILHDIEIDRILNLKLEETISFTLEYITYIFFFIIAINQLGLTSLVYNIIIGIILILVFLFVFYSLKDFIPNFISGLFIKKLKAGDVININIIQGKIIQVNLTDIIVKKKNNDIIVIPYRYLKFIQ